MATKPELKELGDFLNPVLGIPVGGKVYNIPAMSAHNAALIAQTTSAAIASGDGEVDVTKLQVKTEDDAETYMERILGPAYKELVDGGASLQAIQHVVTIVSLWTWSGFDAAQAYFTSGGKVLPAKKKAPADHKPKTATRTRTAAGTTTRKQGSATTTSTRKATASKAPAETKS